MSGPFGQVWPTKTPPTPTGEQAAPASGGTSLPVNKKTLAAAGGALVVVVLALIARKKAGGDEAESEAGVATFDTTESDIAGQFNDLNNTINDLGSQVSGSITDAVDDLTDVITDRIPVTPAPDEAEPTPVKPAPKPTGPAPSTPGKKTKEQVYSEKARRAKTNAEWRKYAALALRERGHSQAAIKAALVDYLNGPPYADKNKNLITGSVNLFGPAPQKITKK